MIILCTSNKENILLEICMLDSEPDVPLFLSCFVILYLDQVNISPINVYRINIHESTLHKYIIKKINGRKEISHPEELKIIYVDIPPKKRQNMISHPFSAGFN